MKLNLVRKTLLALAALVPAASYAVAQTPPLVNPVAPAAGAPAAGQPAVLTLDQTLDMLDKRGQTLDSFTAEVSLQERDETTQIETTRTGRVWYQRLPGGQARIRVSFTERHDGKAKRVEPLDYVLDGGVLLERDHVRKIQIRRQVVKPGQQVNLFRLGDGPFPMPIGQKRDDVKQQFEAKSEPVTKEDKVPAGTSHIVLRPKANTELKRQFSSIDVFVDPQTQMPIRIATLDNKEEKGKTTELNNLQVNPPLKDVDFTLPPIKNEAEWNIRDEPAK